MQTFAESEPATLRLFLSPPTLPPPLTPPRPPARVFLSWLCGLVPLYVCVCVSVYMSTSSAHVLVYTVVCHSQVLAKYARPFVSDLLFWHGRHSTLAAENRIKCFCFVLSLHLSVPFFILRSLSAASALSSCFFLFRTFSPTRRPTGAKRNTRISVVVAGGSGCYCASSQRRGGCEVNDDGSVSPR